MDDYDPVTKLEMALKELDAGVHQIIVHRLANEIVSKMRSEIVRRVKEEVVHDFGDRLLTLNDDLSALSKFWLQRHRELKFKISEDMGS